MSILKVEMVDIESVIPYEKNAKEHPQWQVDQIMSSITEFGMNDPIAIDEKGVVIEGHGRLEACKQLNFKEVPVIRLEHLDEKRKKAYIIAHNKLTMNTGFDMDILAEEISRLKDSIDLSMTGFSQLEIEKMLMDADEDGLMETLETGGQPTEGGDYNPDEEDQNYIIQYNIIFDDEAQKEIWYSYLKWLKANAEGETIAERITNDLEARGVTNG